MIGRLAAAVVLALVATAAAVVVGIAIAILPWADPDDCCASAPVVPPGEAGLTAVSREMGGFRW